MEIKKVLQREGKNPVKYVVIPKHSKIIKGDYVKLEKISEAIPA